MFAGLRALQTTRIETQASRDHTERLFKFLGIGCVENKKGIFVEPLKTSLEGFDVEVVGDFSSASFFIAACLLCPGSRVRLEGVNLNPTRTGFLQILTKMGLRHEEENVREVAGERCGDLEVRYQELNPPPAIDTALVPLMIDEFPLLGLLCSRIQGTHRITGIQELRVKECDRIAVMTETLLKLGVPVKELPDGWEITGINHPFRGGVFSTFSDHRIAMVLKIAALAAENEILLDNEECVGVSFPGFDREFKQLLKT
jgi:3-phosphoshikimate 1-carboxyvinyltransferase